ncbi:LemA family protein [Edaphobacter sp. 12200R-103]|jgi:LemA protein|uniref:LemA family protein n=1 Tax=Edaphobacter sp. 12200R-103 TaxID=2703788 RepID=UPI00138B944C|nr:LemA family protein [Edaphobacter sp. 12200R-103]QHS50943.1 LemA family protein [Edaphobacter sp. 12200R-103]
MKRLWIGLGAVGLIIVLLLLVGGSYVSTKNTLVAKNESINQAYSQVNVVQQRRLDLIPNLVASVKGYVAEESTVLTNIANARAGVLAAGSDHSANIDANRKLDVALGPFFRLQEQYPNLRSNEQFMRLNDELAGTENRIAVERQRYNRTLEDYNVYVRQFPNSIWAGMAGFHYRDEYFRGNPENSVAPKVDFSK